MKILGLIGGTSWHSTIEYYSQINKKVADKIGAHANPELIIHSINIQIMRDQIIEDINNKYLDVSQKLEKAGAQGIMICANTPHMVYEYVQPKIDIPILHIADATGLSAKSKGLKYLGLLGNKPTMTGKFISGYLKNQYDIETIIPEGESLELSHKYVSKELTQGIFSEEAKSFFINQIQILKESGAEGIILGCTELPILLKGYETDIPLLHTTDLHIQFAVDFIMDNK